MITLLTILGFSIFLMGAYFMGNFMLDTFDDDIQDRIMSSIYGVLCWAVIAVVFVIFCGIYTGVSYLLK